MTSSTYRFFLIIFINVMMIISLNSSLSTALDFDVGEETGWALPSNKESNFYNHWASRNRFRPGDTINFKYKKDSVMVVSEDDYEECLSLHPIFFSNNGKTEFQLDHPGTFFFISGVAGHCERGQKMIIRVMSHGESEAPSAANNQTRDGNHIDNDPEKSGTTVEVKTAWVLGSAPLMVSIVMLFGSLF